MFTTNWGPADGTKEINEWGADADWESIDVINELQDKNSKRFQAESVVDYEVGIGAKKKKYSFKANYYYMDFENEITFMGGTSPTGFPLMGNVDKSYRSGVEIDISVMLYDGGNFNIQLANNTSLSDNKITIGDDVLEPLYTPNAIVNQWVIFNYGKFILSGDFKYHSESYIDVANEFTTPSFIVYNTQIGYKFKHGSINLFGGNLTNKQYFTKGEMDFDNNGNFVPHYFVNQLRNYTITLNLTF